MRKLLLTTLVVAMASVLALSGCNRNDVGQSDVGKGISFNGGIATKVSMQDDYSFTWDADEQLGIFASFNSSVYAANVSYDVTESGASSPFEASGTAIDWDGDGGHTFYAYFPYNALAGTDPANVQLGDYHNVLQVQSAANSMDHISDFVVMAATPADVDNDVETDVTLVFNHVMSFVEFNVSAAANDPDGYTISSIDFKATSGEVGVGEGLYMDVTTTPATSGVLMGAVAVVRVEFTTGMPISTTPQSAYMVVYPGDYTSGDFEITLNFSNGTSQDLTVTGAAVLGAGRIRPVNITNAQVPSGGGDTFDGTITIEAAEIASITGNTNVIASGLISLVTTKAEAEGETLDDVTKIIYKSPTVREGDGKGLSIMAMSNSLVDVEFANVTSLTEDGSDFYWIFAMDSSEPNDGNPDGCTKFEVLSFPSLSGEMDTYSIYSYNNMPNLRELDLGMVDGVGNYGILLIGSNLSKLTFRSTGSISLSSGSLYGVTFSNVDLVLNSAGTEIGLASGNTWKGITWKSITGAAF